MDTQEDQKVHQIEQKPMLLQVNPSASSSLLIKILRNHMSQQKALREMLRQTSRKAWRAISDILYSVYCR